MGRFKYHASGFNEMESAKFQIPIFKFQPGMHRFCHEDVWNLLFVIFPATNNQLTTNNNPLNTRT
jgi:hypothetical protein